MVNPKLRFKRPDGTAYPDWAAVQLADIATRVTRKNKDDETDVPLTIASIEGLVDQRTYFGKTVASKDMSGYFLLKNGEFAYNKSYSVGYDYGAIKRLDKYDQGALSTLYICFALNDPSWSDFMVQYFDSLKWNAEMPKICAEGARNHGLLNVAPADFFKISMALPTDPEERDRIVEGLQSITERIECQASRVAALETQKKELLRQVFAREIRFKDESGQDYPEWSLATVGDIIEPYDERVNNDCDLPILTSSKTEGIVFQADHFGREQSHDISGYCVLPRNYCTYRNRSDGVDFTFNINRLCDKGIVSKFYPVFREKGCNLYLLTLVLNNEPSTTKRIAVTAAGTGQKVLSFSALQSMRIEMPSLPEQQRIADFFTALDAQIENERALLEDWRQLKKGLLQQMFV